MNALNILRIGQLAVYLRELLDSNDALYDCWVSGEVSNVSQTGTGHYFFTLEGQGRPDEVRPLQAAGALANSSSGRTARRWWLHGRVSSYEATGNLQFYVDMLQEEGQGALYLAFEQLKVHARSAGPLRA